MKKQHAGYALSFQFKKLASNKIGLKRQHVEAILIVETKTEQREIKEIDLEKSLT